MFGFIRAGGQTTFLPSVSVPQTPKHILVCSVRLNHTDLQRKTGPLFLLVSQWVLVEFLRELCLSSLSERWSIAYPPPAPPSLPRPLPATMTGYCAEYGDGLGAGGYCSSFVAADGMVFVAEKFADVREYEASLKILVRRSFKFYSACSL